jgi:TonB family protein
MWIAVTVMLAALLSPFQTTSETPPLKPLAGNPTCAYPAEAQRNRVAGPVLFTAQVRPDGRVESVDIRQVPAKDLGFEEAVRTCVSKWRFERAAESGSLRPYEGKIRYRISATASEEVAIRVLLQAFASGWNAESPDPEAILDALRGTEPHREVVGPRSPSPLAEQFRVERAAVDWNMELEPDFEQIRFLQPDLAVVRQPFQRRTRPGVGSSGDGKALLEATAIKRGEAWALLGWYSIAGPPSPGQWLAPGIDDLRKLKHVDPVYPDLALQSHVSALVILEARVDDRGHMEQVKILRGHPLFNEAAIEAFGRWEYEPPPFAGTPLSVVKTVDLAFSPDEPRGRVSVQEHSWVTRGPVAQPAKVLESVPVQLPLPGRSIAELQRALGADDPDERAGAAWESAGALPVSTALLERLHELSRGDSEERVRQAAAWGYSHLEAVNGPAGSTRAYDEPARALRTTNPLPPKDPAAQRTGGDVVVEILISERGEVVRAEVRQSVAGLDESALECVKNWLFAPARADGKPVPSVARVSVNFRAYR